MTVEGSDAGPQSEAAEGMDTDAARERLDEMFNLAYAELHRLAAILQHSSNATLGPTALVNEAWLKLSAYPGFHWESPLHFRRIAARAMRQVLVEAARNRTAEKRGGVDREMVTLEPDIAATAMTADAILSLNEALEALATVSPRQVRLIELRFFAGLDVAEAAAALGVSEATAQREWRAGKAWLAHRLSQGD
ncbi:MAG: sigma-70 family RNA polymerase sigma factor [Cytophagaceae bacterium]|nr:sigma-70 family RNA polymerase sigma factor [Gemmatimonadaceae bacterium]